MSVLSQREREALDDVFLSIHTNNRKFGKMKEILPLIIPDKNNLFLKKHLNHLLHGFKSKSFVNLIRFYIKKKKFLSK
ncbi:hypothetical protein JHD48_01350 [Sulfurimonas sp. SAG-AH-194-I05]|nr:hypothetical protein [Sulfurimonas sp. SAG-AH-194-I05]MDF1874375.1 hypothetical protein [Sulfurimonas sp. SAG-AH-194-I05]